MRQLALVWGVTPVFGNEATSTDELLETALKGGKASGLVKAGDLVVITAGIPLGRSGSTNLVKVDTIPAD
ncbi:Pyruvate kinase [compost metagenome]